MSRVNAHVHRFQHFAAIAFTGVDGATVYLTAGDAARLATALQECVADIRTRPNFSQSEFATVSFPLSNNGSTRNG